MSDHRQSDTSSFTTTSSSSSRPPTLPSPAQPRIQSGGQGGKDGGAWGAAVAAIGEAQHETNSVGGREKEFTSSISSPLPLAALPEMKSGQGGKDGGVWGTAVGVSREAQQGLQQETNSVIGLEKEFTSSSSNPLPLSALPQVESGGQGGNDGDAVQQIRQKETDNEGK